MAGDRQSLEQEMDATRERLASTIDQLVHRTNPKTIASRQVAQVRAYFIAEDGSPRTDNILKVAGGVVGVVALMLVVRRTVG